MTNPIRLAVLHLFQALTDNPDATPRDLVLYMKGSTMFNERVVALVVGVVVGVFFTLAVSFFPTQGPEDRCYVVWQRYYEVNPTSPIKMPQPVQTLLVKYPGEWPRNGEIGTIATAERDGCWGIQTRPSPPTPPSPASLTSDPEFPAQP